MKPKFLGIQRFIAAFIWLTTFGAYFSVYSQADNLKRAEIFEEVWNAINEKYYDANFNGVDWNETGKKYRARLVKISGEKEFYELLDRMAGELRDSHTRVYSPAQREQRKNRKYASVGLQISRIENVPVITSVTPDSEAARFGIKPGMRVFSINGEPIEKAIEKARLEINVSSSARATEMRVFSKIIAGETGSKMTISLLGADGRRRLYSLERTFVRAAPVVSAKILRAGIAYLKFDRFDESLEPEINEYLNKFKDASALIIDLRGNAGGDGETGLRFAGRFFDAGQIVARIITRTGKPPVEGMPMTLTTENKSGIVFSKPLAVLIDERTASTAELIANALQETARARIFGTNSCGCVLAFLDYKPLRYGGDMTLSEFGFMTPKNRRIEGAGVFPDQAVFPTLKDVQKNRDVVLEKATKHLQNLNQIR